MEIRLGEFLASARRHTTRLNCPTLCAWGVNDCAPMNPGVGRLPIRPISRKIALYNCETRETTGRAATAAADDDDESRERKRDAPAEKSKFAVAN